MTKNRGSSVKEMRMLITIISLLTKAKIIIVYKIERIDAEVIASSLIIIRPRKIKEVPLLVRPVCGTRVPEKFICPRLEPFLFKAIEQNTHIIR